MRNFCLLLAISTCLCGPASAQIYFLSTASVSGNTIVYKIKAVNGPITCGWSVIEFFFRNTDASPDADAAFAGATITPNATDFPGIDIPYNGMNLQGAETGYNNYWFGTFYFPPTTVKTYNQGQEYVVCTITLASAPSIYNLELVHNEPFFTPDYMVLADEVGADKSNPFPLTGTCKFYGPGATVCDPNCPPTTDGNNHILPLNGSAPVELVDFQARRYGPHTARLNWQTAVEEGFATFAIERQKGQSWQQIGIEPARAVAGSGASYVFFDPDAPAPLAYYRLKMLDRDGSFAYSPIRSVAFDGEKSLRVFPNPATDRLYLQFSDDLEEEDLQVELCDWSGRVVAQQYLPFSPGTIPEFILNSHHLPGGAYLLRAVTPDGFRFAQNIVIQPRY